MLISLGHSQLAIPIKTDNGTVAQSVTDTMKCTHSKSWDVQYHWLAEKQAECHVDVYWDQGKNNPENYHSKNHSSTHHQNVRKNYILEKFSLHIFNRSRLIIRSSFCCMAWRGCAEVPNDVVHCPRTKNVRRTYTRTTDKRDEQFETAESIIQYRTVIVFTFFSTLGTTYRVKSVET